MPKVTLSVDETTKRQLDEICANLKAKGIISSKSEFFRSMINWLWSRKLNDLDLWREILMSRVPQ